LMLLCLSFVYVQGHERIQPLQPIAAYVVDEEIAEPSGLTFCNSTGHLYVICDKKKCHYIYEIDSKGNLIEQYSFDKNFRDIECVACDDVNGIIYMAEESNHIVHSFVLPNNEGSWEEGNNHPKLIPIDEFHIEPASSDTKSGLEGMTVDTKRNRLYIANEKHPVVLYTVSPAGDILNTSYPVFDSGDLSGACYDEALDLLWLVSDQNTRLYITDLTGTVMYDYWDLPLENGEGLAVDNTQDPPLLYISTDPSAPRGPRYVPALFTFIKPSIGSGLLNYDPENPPPYEKIPCEGCDVVYDLVAKNQADYDAEQAYEKRISVLKYSAGFILVPMIIISLGLCIGSIFYVKKKEEGFSPREFKRNAQQFFSSLFSGLESSLESSESEIELLGEDSDV